MELRPTFADVSDFTLKNLADCSEYAHDGGLTGLVVLGLSLSGLLIERARRIHDQSLPAHIDIFDVRPGDCHRSGALKCGRASALEPSMELPHLLRDGRARDALGDKRSNALASSSSASLSPDLLHLEPEECAAQRYERAANLQAG